MENKVQLKCSCGLLINVDLSEEMNFKDRVSCKCGRDFIIVEISDE